MKRIGNIYTKLLDKKLLARAIKNAAKDKGDSHYVRIVLDHMEKYVDKLYDMLENDTFTPSPYREEYLHCDDKIRLIKKHDFFPDRCIEHAIAIIMLPKWDKIVRNCSYASWKGRGINCKDKIHSFTHQAKRYIARHKLKNELYCLKFDIRKCYENVNNDVLKTVIRKYCKDDRMNHLIDLFIDSNEGLPIGSYLSQLLINVLLTQLDLFIMQECRCKEYLRYMDDGAILSEDKQFLHEVKHRIENFLFYELGGMELNNKKQIFPIGRERGDRPLDMCGYCFYRTFTLLRKKIKQAMKKKLDRPRSMASYKGMLLGINSNNLIKALGGKEQFLPKKNKEILLWDQRGRLLLF